MGSESRTCLDDPGAETLVGADDQTFAGLVQGMKAAGVVRRIAKQRPVCPSGRCHLPTLSAWQGTPNSHSVPTPPLPPPPPQARGGLRAHPHCAAFPGLGP